MKQSRPTARQFTRPYLRRTSGREALIGDGGGWRLIGRGPDPTAVLLEGGGLIQEDTFEVTHNRGLPSSVSRRCIHTEVSVALSLSQ